MTDYTVSVVIPAYNAEAHLDRAIASVLCQTRRADEILVVNDGSRDGTSAVIQAFGSRVRGMDRPHQGAAAARNAGIEASSGKLVAFLDADDEWLPQKLALQLEMHRAADLVMSYCRSNELDPDGRDLGNTFRQGRPHRGLDVWRALLSQNFIATPTVIARRDDLLACGGFDESLKVGEDQDMWIRLALRGRVDFIDESLVRVHMRAGSLSSSGFEDQVRYTLKMVTAHLQNLAGVLPKKELQMIRARRFGQVGRNAYANGDWRLGLKLMAHALWLGDKPIHNFYHLLAAAPVMRQHGNDTAPHTEPAVGKRAGFEAS